MYKRKKIMVLTPQTIYPYWFYGRSSMFFTLIYLQKYVDVYVTFPISKENFQDVERLRQYNLKFFPFLLDTKDKISKLIFNAFQTIPFKISKYFSKKYLCFIEQLIAKINPDLIQIHTPHMAIYGFYLMRKYKTPIIFRAQDIVIDQIKSYIETTKNSVGKLIAKWQLPKTMQYELRVWRAFSKSVFITQKDYEKALYYLMETFGEDTIQKELNKYGFIYDGVEIKENLYLKNRSKCNALAFAASDQIQNIESIKHWIENVWKPIYSKLNLDLNIYGKVCKALEKIYNSSERKALKIRLKGYIPDKQTLDLELSRNKAFISPTSVGSGYRTKIFDAGSIGLPVICSMFDYKTLPSDFKNGENILVAETSDEWFRCIKLIEDNKEYPKKLSLKIHSALKEYTWEVAVKHFLDIYDEVLFKL